MSVRTCDHLKEDGIFCDSPALKGRNYCYFHLNLRGRRLKAARARRRGDNPPLNLPFPEDMHAVQVSLAEIMWALAEDRIDTRRAGLILYTLQQASTNLNHTPEWEGAREAVPSTRPLRALNDPNFERRYGLPNHIDLDADLETVPPQPAAADLAVGSALQGTASALPPRALLLVIPVRAGAARNLQLRVLRPLLKSHHLTPPPTAFRFPKTSCANCT